MGTYDEYTGAVNVLRSGISMGIQRHMYTNEFYEHMEDYDIRPVYTNIFMVSYNLVDRSIILQYRYIDYTKCLAFNTPPLLPDTASRMEAYRNTCDNIRNKRGET